MNRLLAFLSSDSGAVTVDWVVLTAAVVGLGIGTVASVRTGSNALASDVSTGLSNASVASLGEMGSDGYTGGWVESSGRGVAWVEEVDCPKGGIVACASTIEYINMSYLMEDGTYWSMQSVQPEGEDAVVTWYDDNGDPVDAPRFREG